MMKPFVSCSTVLLSHCFYSLDLKSFLRRFIFEGGETKAWQPTQKHTQLHLLLKQIFQNLLRMLEPQQNYSIHLKDLLFYFLGQQVINVHTYSLKVPVSGSSVITSCRASTEMLMMPQNLSWITLRTDGQHRLITREITYSMAVCWNVNRWMHVEKHRGPSVQISKRSAREL